MKKYLQIILSVLLCSALVLSCGCSFKFWEKDGGSKKPSSSVDQGSDASDDELPDDSSEDDFSFDDNSDDTSGGGSSNSNKKYDKYNPVGSSGNILPTATNKDKNNKDDDEEVVSDSVKYPESINAEALNKTSLFSAYDVELFTQKIWEGKTVYYETICFEQNKKIDC